MGARLPNASMPRCRTCFAKVRKLAGSVVAASVVLLAVLTQYVAHTVAHIGVLTVTFCCACAGRSWRQNGSFNWQSLLLWLAIHLLQGAHLLAYLFMSDELLMRLTCCAVQARGVSRTTRLRSWTFSRA